MDNAAGLMKLENAEDTRTHLYWYRKYWMHRLYCRGVESEMRCFQDMVPYIEMTPGGPRGGGGSTYLFHWCPLYESQNYHCAMPEINVFGKALFAKADENSSVYERVVEVKREDVSDPSSTYRLYAARHFEKGEAIIFFSEYEERSNVSILGGISIRIVDNPEERNAYMTAVRTIRAAKFIAKGEEITRCATGSETIDALERTDRAVVSQDTMKVGRIVPDHEFYGRDVVYFTEDDFEFARQGHKQLFNNFPLADPPKF
eukprot:CAMPEP_0113601802 /NCGR_PEP_ID=MMETSP0017_2-20120614/422_1 /TAXON_ID=2856 /ORGANISM="Cylindrotheca closterium" /LENGTH=258 /DNA_ID=CAMNT_0000510117 /DNA_START=863 /DNA_END=1636 /DNA_ORIENTATION=+ /assembly_acc=CAM_ASM_000147